MKTFRITLFLLSLFILNSCASRYRTIEPQKLSYNSHHEENGVLLEYKYDLLRKKYAKKEKKKDVRLVAIKIENNSGQDLTYNKDFTITYDNGSQPVLMEKENLFRSLKQKPATHLFYLLLLPVNFEVTSSSNGIAESSSSFPIGLILGPALAGGNLIAASSANKKFKEELETYDLREKTIQNGETVYGLIGLRSDNYDALKIQILDTTTDSEEQSITK